MSERQRANQEIGAREAGSGGAGQSASGAGPMSRAGALVLVATPIGNLGDLSPRAVKELADADVIAAEDTRRARKLLTAAGIAARGRVVAVHSHNEAAMAKTIAAQIRTGLRVVCVTDAGMPGISDPGARLVRECIAQELPVEVVPGPSAVLAAVVLSGFPPDRFVFEGFLPRKGKERAARIEALVGEARPVVVFEAPTRLGATLRDLGAVLGPERPVALVRELTKMHEEVWRGSLGECADGAPVAARGEVAIVVGPAPTVGGVDDGTVEAALTDALDGGASSRDAAAEVAAQLGVSKRRAYELAVRMRATRPR